MRKITISAAKESERKDIEGLLSFSKAPHPSCLGECLASGRAFTLRVDGQLGGLALIGHELEALLPGDSPKTRRVANLLDEAGYKGEPINVLLYFFVHPSLVSKGLNKDFWLSLSSRYKEASWFAPRNEISWDLAEFLSDFGFIPLREDGLEILMKPYVPQGLCRNIKW